MLTETSRPPKKRRRRLLNFDMPCHASEIYDLRSNTGFRPTTVVKCSVSSGSPTGDKSKALKSDTARGCPCQNGAATTFHVQHAEPRSASPKRRRRSADGFRNSRPRSSCDDDRLVAAFSEPPLFVVNDVEVSDKCGKFAIVQQKLGRRFFVPFEIF